MMLPESHTLSIKTLGRLEVEQDVRAPELRHLTAIKLEALKTIASMFQGELASLSSMMPTATTSAELDLRINFHDEVERFQIDLIKTALRLEKGHQIRAARRLGLPVTTLNSMIKRYQIDPRDDSIMHASSELPS